MKPPHIPHYDPQDPDNPYNDNYNPETIWDDYLEACNREYEDRKCNE